jgi:hypothetical protein
MEYPKKCDCSSCTTRSEALHQLLLHITEKTAENIFPNVCSNELAKRIEKIEDVVRRCEQVLMSTSPILSKIEEEVKCDNCEKKGKAYDYTKHITSSWCSHYHCNECTIRALNSKFDCRDEYDSD